MANSRANLPGDQSQIKELADKCARLALLGQFIATFEDPEMRIDLIRLLRSVNIVSEYSAELLLDNYVAGCD